jgi:hypothetical protein
MDAVLAIPKRIFVASLRLGKVLHPWGARAPRTAGKDSHADVQE